MTWTIITFDNENPNQNYVVSNWLLDVVHAPLKTKTIRGTDAPFVVNNSEKLFIAAPGWKIKYTKILRKKIKWHIKSKESFVYIWKENVWKTTSKNWGRKVEQPTRAFGSSWSRFL